MLHMASAKSYVIDIMSCHMLECWLWTACRIVNRFCGRCRVKFGTDRITCTHLEASPASLAQAVASPEFGYSV